MALALALALAMAMALALALAMAMAMAMALALAVAMTLEEFEKLWNSKCPSGNNVLAQYELHVDWQSKRMRALNDILPKLINLVRIAKDHRSAGLPGHKLDLAINEVFGDDAL